MLVFCYSPSKVNILVIHPLCVVLGHGVCKAIFGHSLRRVLEGFDGFARHISISLWASGKVNAAKSRVLVFDNLGGSEFRVSRKWFQHIMSHQCLCNKSMLSIFRAISSKNSSLPRAQSPVLRPDKVSGKLLAAEQWLERLCNSKCRPMF